MTAKAIGMDAIPRELTAAIQRALRTDRVVALMGPRQAGKTTLVTELLGEEHALRHYNLKDPDVRRVLTENARREFLRGNRCTIVLDEVQRLPDLLELVQVLVDERPDQTGQFLILGSNHLLLDRHIKESLAGRVAVFTLHPLTLRERAGIASEPVLVRLLACESVPHVERVLDELHFPAAQSIVLADCFAEGNLYGGYPEFLTRRDPSDRQRWLRDYRQTYLETDLRQLVDLKQPESFETFEGLFAPRVASLFNASELARDCRLSADTVRRFCRYYQQLFVAWPLRPFHRNYGKRVMKMPKWYFHDTGLLRSLLRDFREDSGAFFENTVVAELRKRFALDTFDQELFFLRTSTGVEADVVFHNAAASLTYFVEIKQTRDISSTDYRHLRRLTALDDASIGLLIHTGVASRRLAERIWSVPAHWLLA